MRRTRGRGHAEITEQRGRPGSLGCSADRERLYSARCWAASKTVARAHGELQASAVAGVGGRAAVLDVQLIEVVGERASGIAPGERGGHRAHEQPHRRSPRGPTRKAPRALRAATSRGRRPRATAAR
ncbi:MAG: hypothetical protein U0360_05790 [Dehalococcoidia bacterium]